MNYETIPNIEVVKNTQKNLAERGIETILVETKKEALEKIKELIPAGASINNGSSTSLIELGFVDYLKSKTHPWNNLHEKVLEETDEEKKAQYKKDQVFADYYLGSVHALSETGEIVIASASGSQLPHIVFTSPNIIFVVSTNKITPTLEDAIKRLREYVVPLEDERMKKVGMGGTTLSKILIINNEPTFMGRKVRMILVNEKLGY